MIISSSGGIVLWLVAAISTKRNKQYNIYFSLSGLAAIVLTMVTVSVIFSFLLRTDIDNQLNKVNVRAELARAAMAVWVSLQDWEPVLNGSYPDS